MLQLATDELTDSELMSLKSQVELLEDQYSLLNQTMAVMAVCPITVYIQRVSEDLLKVQ
jgi:hypothetical protein